MKKNEPSITWFVEPLDAHTNEIIAKNLLALSRLDENISLADSEGKEHSVYQVENHFFVSRLYKDKRQLSLRFNVYTVRSHGGPLRPWKFEEPKYKEQRQAGKKAKKAR